MCGWCLLCGWVMQPLVCRFWRARPPSLRAVWRCCVAPQVCVAEPRASGALAACMLCPQALGVLHSHRPPGVPHLSPHAGAGGNSVSQQRSHQCSSATHRGEQCGAAICGNSCTVGMRAVQVQAPEGAPCQHGSAAWLAALALPLLYPPLAADPSVTQSCRPARFREKR